jgi:hypothetical protein
VPARGYTPLAASLDRDAAYAGVTPINRSVMPPPITTPQVRFGPAVRVMSAGCTTCPGPTERARMSMRDGLHGLSALPAGDYMGAIGHSVSGLGAVYPDAMRSHHQAWRTEADEQHLLQHMRRSTGLGMLSVRTVPRRGGAVARHTGVVPTRQGMYVRQSILVGALGAAGLGSTESDICVALRAGASIDSLASDHCAGITDAGWKAACKGTFLAINAGIAAACAQVDAAGARADARAAAAARAKAAQEAADAAAAQAAADAQAAAAMAAGEQPKSYTPTSVPATNYVPYVIGGVAVLAVAWWLFK